MFVAPEAIANFQTVLLDAATAELAVRNVHSNMMQYIRYVGRREFCDKRLIHLYFTLSKNLRFNHGKLPPHL